MNQQKNRKRRNNRRRGMRINKTMVFLVLFCLCIGGASLVSARYIKQTDTNNNSVSAQEFYFESDLLDGETHEIVPTDADGTASVTVRLMNYVDDLRYSETEIKYEVNVVEENSSTESGVTITCKTDTNTNDTTKTITPNEKHYADVTISGLQAGKIYTVTATTNNTYQKTLTGTIKVATPDATVHASISTNTDQYIEVTLWTTDYAGPITLKYASDIGLVPDNTDSLMSGKTTGKNINVENWETNTSHVFRFFKTADATGKAYQTAVEGTEVTVSVAQ